MADSPRAVVLAAGRGTRMRSDRAKVLHPLGGRPLILHVLDAVAALGGPAPVVVISPDHPEVRALLGERAECVEQAEPLGTGDALRSLPPRLRDQGPVLVLSGDVPLITASTLAALVARHTAEGPGCSLLGVLPADPSGLGRIVGDEHGLALRIVEERDLPPGEPPPALCNAGVYVFEGARLWPVLDRLTADNAQGERYLTDAVELLGPASVLVTADAAEALGINDRAQLAQAETLLRWRTLLALMRDGVSVEDPATTYVDAGVVVGRDSVLRPMSVLRGATRLGAGCEVGPMAQLRDVRGGDRVRIAAAALDECELEDDVVVGQFARLRPGTLLRHGTRIGTHAEVKNSTVGPNARISHFSCVLDSDVGEGVNVSAGAITCNYDGFSKNRTVIGDGVFVGSDCMLVAPLRIGDGAYLAAGSVITHDVPAGALAVERAPERSIEGWARKRRERAAQQEAATPPAAEATAPGRAR